MYGAFVPLVGAVLTVMSLLNSRLSAAAGSVAGIIVIHAVGLVAAAVVLAIAREPRRPGRLPLYAYLGGVLGVGTVFATVYSFNELGASLAVALALLGQTVCSIVIDATGFLGRPVYPLSARRLPGILLAAAGIAIMAGGWRANVPALLAGLVAGIIPGITFTLNSELGRKKGVFHSVIANYVTGLGTILVIAVFVRPPIAASARAVLDAGPILALGGGLLGVGMVSSMNVIFPRVPAFSATLLLFGGQALSGVLVDWVASGSFDARKLVGTIVVLAGLALNTVLSPRAARRTTS